MWRACSSCKLRWKEDRDAGGGTWRWTSLRLIYRNPARTFAFYIFLGAGLMSLVASRAVETRSGTASTSRLPAPPLPSPPRCPLPATTAPLRRITTPYLRHTRAPSSKNRRRLSRPYSVPSLPPLPSTLQSQTGRGLGGAPAARGRCLGRKGGFFSWIPAWDVFVLPHSPCTSCSKVTFGSNVLGTATVRGLGRGAQSLWDVAWFRDTRFDPYPQHGHHPKIYPTEKRGRGGEGQGRTGVIGTG